ncbi:hypothetical protein ACLESO_43125 [Pyxidicoccus sp. 3LG]
MREALVETFQQGDEARARTLVLQLGQGARQVRSILAAMLDESDAHARCAGAFGLGVLGGTASIRLLEQQLAIEGARGDYDGASVADVITQALSHIKEAGARASLVKRLERLASGTPPASDMYSLVYALWRQRHPDLLPSVTRALRTLSLPDAGALLGLRILLEKSPGELREWVGDPDVPLEEKTWVLSILDKEVPGSLHSVFPEFISVAASAHPWDEAMDYAECLLSVLLSHREQLVPALPEETRLMLRSVALGLLASTNPNCSLRAAVLLQHIGRPEDAGLIDAFRPEDSIGARVFDDAARTLRRKWDA